MKRLFVVLALVSAVQIAFGQDAATALSKAKKGLNAFNNATDQFANAHRLDEAAAAADEAVTYDENKALPAVWVKRGQVYAAMLTLQDQAIYMKKDYKAPAGAAFKAYESFMKAKELGAVKSDLRDVLDGIGGVMNGLNAHANNSLEAKNYWDAYQGFMGMSNVNELLVENKRDALLNDTLIGDLLNTAINCAILADRLKDAKPTLDKLYATKTAAKKQDYPSVYDALYRLTQDPKYLEEGRARYPDETSLLFSEINHYLGKGELDKLIDKLKQGIAKEPGNLSLYVTLGQVYDQLAAKSKKDNDAAKAKEYADAALSYYNQTLAKDAGNFSANYALGLFYYNIASSKIDELNALSSDLSKAGQAKYEAKEKEMNEAFDQALPYFQKAEIAEPNDTEVLTALKEIYAKKGEYPMSNEFKSRLEKIQGGGKNTSYFKK